MIIKMAQSHRRILPKPSTSLSSSKPTSLMASLLSLSLLSLLLFFSLSSAAHHKTPPRTVKQGTVSPEIQQACKATRYPETCETALTQSSHVPPHPTPMEIIQLAISVSSTNLATAISMAKSILDSSTGNLNRTTAAKNCLETLNNSQYRISRTVDALPRGGTKDARAWMSAALSFQYDCWSGLKYANDTSQVDKTMAFLNSLIGLTSNALAMIMAYDISGNQTGSWAPPKTERDGSWDPVGSGELGIKGGFPPGLKADVTVCRDGSGGCYKRVQDAVNAAPDNEWGRKFVISIKEGVYTETVRVPLEKKNVVFLGEGMGKTVITASAFSGQPGVTTYNSATVGK